MSKPLLVLDTNVVLDLLHFDDALARPLRQALEAGRVRCTASAATLEEWRRVLAYPEFALDPASQAALFARYRAWAEPAGGVDADAGPGTQIHDGLSHPSGWKPAWGRMPRCSDPDDQKFVELAAAAGAAALVSKDRALLRLRRPCAPLFRVMSVAEAVRWLAELPA